MSCSIANLIYAGNTTTNFTTRRNTTINVAFSVTPLNGTAYSTNFTFNITKAKNLSAINFTECNFGYVDTKLNEYVILNTDLYIKNPSAANESYTTVLPATSGPTLTVFAQCMDINGLVTYFNKTIILVNQTVNATIAF